MLVKAVHRALDALYAAIFDTGTAILDVIRVDQLFVCTGVGHAHRVAFAQDGVKVADNQEHLALGVPAQERDHALFVIIRHDPLEPFPAARERRSHGRSGSDP